MQAFLGLLNDASQGSGRVMFLAGEPGIGKTALLHEFARVARNAGWQALLGHAYDSEGMPPYLPFTEALREYLVSATDTEVAALPPEVAALIPKLQMRVPRTEQRPHFDPASERYRSFEAICSWFADLAHKPGSCGLLLGIEDIHWADESTLLLLEHLARRLHESPTVLAVTFRDTEVVPGRPLARTIEQLARLGNTEGRSLRPFDAAGVAMLLEALGGAHPPQRLVDAVYGETEGNPLFVREVYQYLTGEGRLFDEQGHWRPGLRIDEAEVPQGIQLVIGRRFKRLSEGCRQALTVASVIGRAFDFELLREVSGAGEAALFGAMDEAAQAHLITSGRAADGDAHLVFTHELVRQTLVSDLSLHHRRALHLAVAEAIERLHARDLGPYSGELAQHYRLAGPRADRARAVDFAARAGDQAATVLAFEEALRFYDFALEGLNRHGHQPGGEAAIAGLRLKRAEALISLGQWQEARPELLSAVEGLVGERQAEVLIRLAQASLLQFFDVPGARLHANRAASLARNLGRPDLEAGACGVLAQATFLDGRLRSSIELYSGSYSQEYLQSPLLRQSFANLPIALYLVADFSAAASYAREAIEASRAAGDSYNLVAQLSHAGLSLAAVGHYEEGLAAFAEARQVADERPIPSVLQNLSRAVSMSAGVHLEAFDLAGAEALAEEARELGRSTNFPPAVTSEALDLLFIFARRHEPGGSEDILQEVEASLPGATGAHYYQWRVRLAVAQAELALARADWRVAIDHASEGLDLNERMGRPKYEALALTARGQALDGLGRKRDAISDLRRAVEVVRPVGSPAMLLRAAAALLAVEADAALAADARLAADQVLTNLTTAGMRRNFSDADAVRLIYRLTSGDSRLARERSSGWPDRLTGREVEILRLIAQARSSKEIADQVVLSVRTVERHIANIYLKTVPTAGSRPSPTRAATAFFRPALRCSESRPRRRLETHVAGLHSSCYSGGGCPKPRAESA
jgi:DNA-binding NarL/FixJ family response regulator